jgi:hypothetical protein
MATVVRDLMNDGEVRPRAVSSGRALLSSAAATCGEICRAPGTSVSSAFTAPMAPKPDAASRRLAWRQGERNRARYE